MTKNKIQTISIIIITLTIIITIIYNVLVFYRVDKDYINSSNAYLKSDLIYSNGWILKNEGDYFDIIGHEKWLENESVILFPSTVDGKPIKHFLDEGKLSANRIFVDSGNYLFNVNTNVFSVAFVFLSVNPLDYCNGLFSNQASENNLIYRDYSTHIFVPKDSLDKYKVYCEFESKQPAILPANISFMYNYEGAPNDGYYWVDACFWLNIYYIEYSTYGKPKRDGYIFKGWGLTSGGDSIVTEEEANLVYLETKELTLYARWEKV